MDFSEDDDVKEFRSKLEIFLKEEVPGPLKKWIEEKTTPREMFELLGKNEFLGFTHKNGIQPLPWLQNIYLYRDLSILDGGAAISAMVHAQLGCQAVYDHGTEEQKEKYLLPGVTGESTIAFANTEPNAGSDAAGITTTAIEDGDHFIVNGTKTYITNGDNADHIIFTVITNPEEEKKHRRISMLIVDANTEGITRTRLDKHPWEISHLSTIKFKDVKIPKENILGERKKGFYQTMHIFNASRIGVAAVAFGASMGAFKAAYQRAKTRHIFDKPLADFESKRYEMADRITELEAAWLLLQKVAWLKDNNKDFLVNASIAKLYNTETGIEITQWAQLMFGASGVLKQNKVSKYALDARGSLVGEGAPVIQKKIIFENIDKVLDSL